MVVVFMVVCCRFMVVCLVCCRFMVACCRCMVVLGCFCLYASPTDSEGASRAPARERYLSLEGALQKPRVDLFSFMKTSISCLKSGSPETHNVYIYIYIYVYTHLHVYVNTYIYIYIHTSRCIYTYIYIYIHTCVYVIISHHLLSLQGPLE